MLPNNNVGRVKARWGHEVHGSKLNVCDQTNANKISKQMDLTPRMLSLISGALALIPIESTPRGGVNRCKC